MNDITLHRTVAHITNILEDYGFSGFDVNTVDIKFKNENESRFFQDRIVTLIAAVRKNLDEKYGSHVIFWPGVNRSSPLVITLTGDIKKSSVWKMIARSNYIDFLNVLIFDKNGLYSEAVPRSVCNWVEWTELLLSKCSTVNCNPFNLGTNFCNCDWRVNENCLSFIKAIDVSKLMIGMPGNATVEETLQTEKMLERYSAGGVAFWPINKNYREIACDQVNQVCSGSYFACNPPLVCPFAATI